MKKTLKITLKILGGIIAFILLIVLTVPFIFEDTIAKKALKIVNEQVDAEISIEDLDLTLYRNFPDFTLELNELKVKNNEKFKNIELASIKRFEVVLGLSDAISGNLRVKTIGIVEPTFNVIVDTLGNANYDIAKKIKVDSTKIVASSEEIKEEEKEEKEEKVQEEEKEEESASNFKIALDEFFIENANISYDDKKGGMKVVIKNFNHKTTGDFTLTNLIAKTKTSIEDIIFEQGGITLLKETNFYANLNANIDNKNKIYKIEENEIGLNEIKFLFAGVVKMPEDKPMDIDMKFNTKKVEFKDLLSMIPGAFKHHIKGLKTSGEFKIEGNVKGKFKDSLMPAFNLSLLVKDGFIQYPDVPKPIDKLNINIDVNRTEGISLDNTKVSVSKFNMDFGGNPIKISANVKTPISDPDLSADIVANIDLSKIKDVIPLDKKDDVNGKITSDVHLKGKLSYIEKEQFDKFYAKGNIDLSDINYSSEKLPFKKLVLNKLLFKFSPYTLDLAKVDILAGNSDLKLNGKVHNYLGYAFKNKTLKGTLNVISKKLLLDELAGGEKKEEEKNEKDKGKKEDKKETPKKIAKKEKKPEMEAILLPGKIDFKTTLNLSKVNYGNIKMKKVKGSLGLKNKTAYLKKISVELLEGKVILNGNYNSKNEKSPKADMDLNIAKLDIETTIQTFPSVKKIAPQIGDAKGKFSAALDLKTSLTKNMQPNYKTLYSKGNIKTQGIKIKTMGAVRKLGDALKSKSLQNPKIKDFNIKYTISKGVLNVSPIEISMGKVKGTIGGKTYIETQTLDMIAKFDVPMSELGPIAKGLEQAVALAKKNKLKVSVSEKVNIKVKIHGKATSPEYNILYGRDNATSISGFISNEIKRVKEKSKEELKKKGTKKIKKEAKKLYEKNKDKIKNAFKGLFK